MSETPPGPEVPSVFAAPSVPHGGAVSPDAVSPDAETATAQPGPAGPAGPAVTVAGRARPAGPTVTVVGIGADGWAGLSEPARRTVRAARVLLGADRQLDLIPERIDGQTVGGRRVSWPSPLLPALPGLLAEHAGDPAEPAGGGPDGDGPDGGGLCVLASGDPMFFGIGTTLVRLLGADRVRVVAHPSSVSLACARLGWAVDVVDVMSAVGRPLALVRAALAPGRRLIVLSADRTTPAALAGLLLDEGYGESVLTVLEQLGGPDEAHQSAPARTWAGLDPAAASAASAASAAASAGGASASGPLRPPADLNVIAVEPVAGPGAGHRPRTPGLPDDAFEHDGQITKREVRAVTLARLGPRPGELLWDVGAGSGSIAIEWMRTHPACRAVAVEPRADRADRIARNASALGVPDLRIVLGRAPDVLSGLPGPDAVFIGGGVTTPGLLDACWSALRGRGRLVVNAVTLESEAVLVAAHARLGGELIRLSVSRAAPVGGFTGWRPAMPVTQWTLWGTASP